MGARPKGVKSPELPMQNVPLGSSLPREKFPEDASEFGFFEEKYESPTRADETTPLSAYIEHHLKNYSANANTNGEFPRSAPVYNTGFNAPQRHHNHHHSQRGHHTVDRNGYYDEECSSPESAYTQTDGAYTPSTASEYFDHPAPPSAPPMLHYTQQERRQSKRMSRSRSPVAELLKRRSHSFHRQSMNLATNPTIVSEPQATLVRKRPPPLPLEEEDLEFTINSPEYHHHEEDQHHEAPYMLPLPQSALPTGVPGKSAGLSPRYSPSVHSSTSVRSGRSSGRLRSATRSARSPAQVPIPVTPMSGLDHSVDSIVISPTPEHGSFSDVPYPRSAR